MSTSYQGAPDPSGHAGFQRVPVQPVGQYHAAPVLTLTRFEQPSQERLVSNQIRKLTVRLLIGVLDLMINELPGDTRMCFWNSTRYDPAHPTAFTPDQSVGVVRDKG